MIPIAVSLCSNYTKSSSPMQADMHACTHTHAQTHAHTHTHTKADIHTCMCTHFFHMNFYNIFCTAHHVSFWFTPHPENCIP